MRILCYTQVVMLLLAGCKNEESGSSLKSRQWQLDTAAQPQQTAPDSEIPLPEIHPDSVNARNSMLVGKWQVVSLLVNNMPNDEAQQGNMFLQLKADHTYESRFRSDAQPILGQWKMTGKGKYLKLANESGEVEVYVISQLEPHRLILELEQLDFLVRIQLKK